MTKTRNALTLPLCQSIAGMMTDGQWAMDDGLFSDVMERHSIAEASDDDTIGTMMQRSAMGYTPAESIRRMFPEDFDEDDDGELARIHEAYRREDHGPYDDEELMGDPDEYSDDDLPDPVTMDWECPYWADPEVDDDLLIAARLHREHRLSLGLED